MSIITTVDERAGLVCHRVDGPLSLVEIIDTIERLFGAGGFASGMAILVDVQPGATTGLTAVDLSAITRALQGMGEARGSGRTALVAYTDADLGMVRVLSHVLRQGTREMQVFRDREEALAWLER